MASRQIPPETRPKDQEGAQGRGGCFYTMREKQLQQATKVMLRVKAVAQAINDFGLGKAVA